MKDLQESFLAELDAQLTGYGFRRPSRSQSFYQRNPWGKSAFHISFIRHQTDCDLTADVAVRIDVLEDLVDASTTRLSKAEKKNTFSLGAELGNISEGKPRRWTLTTFGDIGLVVPSVVAAFRNVGLPYLEKHADPQNAFEALRRNDRSSWLHSPFHAERCKQIVALAVLLGRVDELAKVVEECGRFLKDRNDPELADFLAFAEEIRKRPVPTTQS